MYTGGFYYDCTFSVGENENKKLFKCHKIILAEASEAIANILFKNFAEGQNGKDDPIVIDNNLLPETFDLAMRHIYGNVVEFKTTQQACEVYKFAHKWMLKNLKEDAVSALRKTKADEILLVYEMHKSLGDKEEQKFYLQRIMSETSEVLSSPTWLKATPSTVLEIYEKPSLAVVSEKDLFEALIKWGTAHSETTGSELRSTIDSALKQIRFLTMFCPDFAELCAEKANVFSAEEKFKIMLSLELGNSKITSNCNLTVFPALKSPRQL
ncbi:Hypothetical predicted protein [Cloeon dipterum]|uniref:BTB domain-containing protein n=1 Tax=Cloeon dipterum TaxID=197152 RepID=A0A8S1CQ53_9INSE|nr:Hypothetical predicted protein [Cloeon dipterum]